MSEKETKPRFAGVFEHTQNSYWRGPWYPYWTLIVVSVLGGFFGLDHLYLRSPTTAFLKTIINILFLGIWYIYDLLQIIGEKEHVLKYGLSAPGVGALGIGAEMFVDDHPGVPLSKSPFRFLAYMLLLLLPFGFDYLVAGDVNGALLKFFMSFIPILWPIALILGVYNWGRATFSTKDLFDKGTYRIFPFNLLGMATYGYSRMGPVNVPAGGDTTLYESITGLFSYIFSTISSVFSWIIAPITWAFGKVVGLIVTGFNLAIGPIKWFFAQLVSIFTNVVLPVLVQSGKAVLDTFTMGAGAAVEATAKAVEEGAVAASEVAKTVGTVSKEVATTVKEVAPKAKNVALELGTQIKETAKAVGPSVTQIAKNVGNIGEQTADVVSSTTAIGQKLGNEFQEGVEGADKLIQSVENASQASNTLKNASGAVGAASKAVEGSLNKLVTPEGLKALAATAPAAAVASASMQGGGIHNGGSSDEFGFTSMALFALFVLVLGSGTYIAIKRLNTDIPLFQKHESTDNKRRTRNDTPPKP